MERRGRFSAWRKARPTRAGRGPPTPIRPRTLAYEPVYPWITGMAVAEWETMQDRDQTSATVGAQETRREESLT